LCQNCHDPHGTANAFDMLNATWLNLDGHDDPGQPAHYELCFSCHSSTGPAGLRDENKRIADYYDQSINNDFQSGHQIRKSTRSASAWPSNVQVGDKLPCYDCHNPHGSRGNDGLNPNGKLLSDQRPFWGNLTDTLNDAAQCRKFCFGCHIPSNQTQTDPTYGNRYVEGITMAPIPNTVTEHAAADTTSCYGCHGSDYTTPTSRNVHHPNAGDSEAQETPAREEPDGGAARVVAVQAEPGWVAGGTATVRVVAEVVSEAKDAKGDKEMSPYLYVDTVGNNPVAMKPAPQSGRDRAPSQPGRRLWAAEVPTTGWTPGSSHALYVGPAEADRTALPGVVVAVIPDTAVPRREQIVLTYYQDADLTRPFPTPNGIPRVPSQGVVYLRASRGGAPSQPAGSGAPSQPAGSRATLELRIDAPGTLNDVELQPQRTDPEGTSIYLWELIGGPEVTGMGTVTLAGSDRRPFDPLAGARMAVGEFVQSEFHYEFLADPDVLDADGESAARITVTVTDAQGNPVPHRTIDFQRLSGGGTLVPEFPITNPRGEARARYVAGRTVDTAVLEATDLASGQKVTGVVQFRLQAAATITLTPSSRSRAAGEATLVMTAQPAELPADGVSTSRIVAVLRDRDGLPKANAVLRFEVSGRNGFVTPLTPQTDDTGRLEAMYVAGRRPGTVTITASDPFTRATGAVTVRLVVGGPAHLEIEVTPSELPADGESVARITVTVTDLQNRPVRGARVTLEDRWGLVQLVAVQEETDARGQITAVFQTGRRAGVEIITATVLSPLPDDWEGKEPSSRRTKEGPGRGTSEDRPTRHR
jgi:hypothetical protein